MLRDHQWMHKKYIEENNPASVIAVHLGVSTNRVKKALVLLNIRKTPSLSIDSNKLRRLYVTEQKPLKDTAAEFGVSTWTIMKWLAAENIHRRGHHDIDKATWRGRKHSASSKLKISISKDEGRRIYSQCKQCFKMYRYYVSQANGDFCSSTCFEKFRRSNAKDWTEYEQVTDSPEYRRWRAQVYERDHYRCRWCGQKPADRELHAHHIRPRSIYPNLVFEISNGITLCASCHYQTYHREEELAPEFERMISVADEHISRLILEEPK